MASLATPGTKQSPAAIEIDVDFYDAKEKKALQGSKLGKIFEDIPRKFSIPVQDLCAYYLYYKLRPGVAGFADHSQVARKWHQALVEFDGQVEFGETSIYATSLEDGSTGTTERLGEALGLSVASQLHEFHQGDWVRIPIAKTMTADFRRKIASDGLNFVELETKGSILAEISKKPSTIRAHKKSIKDKKKVLRTNGDTRTVMYGTIAVLDDQPGSVAKCWLVDPPSVNVENPRQFKIVARLEYIAELISLLGGRSNLAASLQTRLAALRALPDIMPLDSIPLRRGDGEEYAYESFKRYGERNSWFARKTVVSDGPAGGQLDLVSRNLLFFIGIREELVEYAARQDFDEIETYRFPPASIRKTLNCVVPMGRFRSEFAWRFSIPDGVARRERGYMRFELPALLHYTQSGLVLGTAEIPEDWKR